MSSLLIRVCVFLALSCWGNDVASGDRNGQSSPSTVPRLEKLLERSNIELDEKRLEEKFGTPHWQQIHEMLLCCSSASWVHTTK